MRQEEVIGIILGGIIFIFIGYKITQKDFLSAGIVGGITVLLIIIILFLERRKLKKIK